MSGTKQGGLKAAQKNLASNPNFYAEIGRKGGSATFESHGTCKGFAQDIEWRLRLNRRSSLCKKVCWKTRWSYKQT